MIKNTFTRTLSVAFISMSLTTMASQPARADLHKAVGAAVLLCALGACKKPQPVRPPTGMSSAQRQANMDTQSALNAFNFPVGTVDGSIGPRSRAAISNYQSYMGMPATGRLDDYQRGILVDSWRRMQAGAGSAYPRMMAAEGARGLLRTALNPQYPAQYGDNLPGMGNPPVNNNGGWGQNGTEAVNNNQQQTWPNNNNGTVNQNLNNDNGGQVIAKAQPLAKLPTLKRSGQQTVSIASRCELVSLTTQTQGPITAVNMSDPDQALSEKFCDARSFAITKGQSTLADYSISEGEISELCETVTAAMAPAMTGLPTAAPNAAALQAQGISTELGLDASSAEIYGQICLGIGYRQDNASMALASALTMVAAGQTPYGEIVGHHMREGFGTVATPASAGAWYNEAVNALEQGAVPAFNPSTTNERISVIRAALQQGATRAKLKTLPGLVPVSNTATAN